MTKQVRKGGAKESTIDRGVTDVPWVIDVSTTRAKEFHSMKARQVRGAYRQAELMFTVHTRAAPKVAACMFRSHRSQTLGCNDEACMNQPV